MTAPVDPLAARKRAQAPTSFERKLGFRTAPYRTPIAAPRPQPYCAATPEQAAKDVANNRTLRLSKYLTAADTWKGWR